MALNKFTQIGNSGFGTDTSINTTGIVTAASFSGDGSGLTGITALGSGVVVQEEGSNVGTAQTINFIGSGVTATFSGGIASVEIATSGGGGGGGLSNVVEDTTPQLGGNLDLNSNNITGTGDISITGDATFSGDLDVDGHVNLDNVSVAGVSTFSGTTEVKNSQFRVTNSSASGQYLQITQNGNSSLNLDKVGDGAFYIRGNNIYLQNDGNNETYAGFEANGRSYLNYDASTKFETTSTGAIVTGTLVATATTATNVTVTDEASDTECFVMFGVNATGDNAPKSSSSLKYNSSTGGLSAGSFIGDGSGLTGITASGSGVIVRDGGSLVGTAGTIDFGSNVSVSPISAGVVTVTASAGSIPGINTSGTTQVNNLTATGVSTFNAVRIGDGGDQSTNNLFFGVDNDLKIYHTGAHAFMENSTGNVYLRSSAGTSINIEPAAGSAGIIANAAGAVNLYYSGSKKFETSGVGVTITSQLDTTNIVASGVITATTFSGSGASLTTLNASELDSGTIPDDRFPATLPAVSGANLTNLPSSGISTAFTNVQATWSVGGDTGGYTFTGPGQDGAEQNPDIYLVRGQRYRFINTTGTGHPFRIQSDTSGTAYTDGVSGSQSGTQDFNVQHDAPVRLYYQCTIHSGMIGNIYIVGGSDWRMTDVTTAQTPEIFTNLNVGIGTDNPDASLHIHRDNASSFDAIWMSGSAKRKNVIKVNNSDNLIVSVDEDDEGGDSQFRLQIDGSEKIRVKSTGLVGINTTTPQSRLEVFTDDDTDFGNSSNTNNTNSLIRLFNKNGTDNTAVNNYVGIRFDVANGATSSAWLSYVRTGNNTGAFQFKARNAASSYPEVARILSSGGITFGGDTAQANALDDYEEGELGWRLQRSNAIGSGSNHSDTSITYTKVGNRVYVSGYLYTANTGNSTGIVAELRDDSNVNNYATLPYVPNQSGGFPITGTRTLDDSYRNMAVTFRHGQAQVYIYNDDGNNAYLKNTNNVNIGSAQTHMVIQFCGSYTTNS